MNEQYWQEFGSASFLVDAVDMSGGLGEDFASSS
jgi:hypothetical protein